jgi:outer membrane protein assembly factor BamD (BamD/ComL family)
VKHFGLSQPFPPPMLTPMTFRLIACILLPASALSLVSCGPDADAPSLAGNTQSAAIEGEAFYQKAKEADEAGKTAKAIKLYDQTATRYPFAPSAPQARFRQAELLQQRGEIVKSFEAYDKFLSRFQGSELYTTALNRQAAMAQSAADGDIKSSLLGIKTKLSLEKTVEMLGKVRDNAPKSAIAAKAQFTIGQLYESKKKYKDAIAAYRQLVKDQPNSAQAPEALFRVGIILTDEADRGNQNQGNLDLAREAFNDYLIQYPGDSRNAEARRLEAALGNRDFQRSYDIAEFYLKTGKPESAKVYYRDIITRAKSGEIHDKSKARLKELGE